MSKIDKILISLGTNNSSQIATAVLAGFKMIFLPVATMTDKTATPDQKKYTIIRDIIMEGLALVTYIGVTGQIQKHVTAPIVSAYYKNIAKKLKEGKIKPAVGSESEVSGMIEVLESVDYKKIKEAGQDFLTQISQNHKKMSNATKKYMDVLNDVVKKINGDSANTQKQTFTDYLSSVNEKYTNPIKTGGELNKTAKSTFIFEDIKRAAKDSKKVLDPMKVFQNTRIALSQLSVWTLALIIIPPMCNAIIAPIMKEVNKKLSKSAKSTEGKENLNVQPFNQMSYSTEKKQFAKFYNYFPGNNTGMRV